MAAHDEAADTDAAGLLHRRGEQVVRLGGLPGRREKVRLLEIHRRNLLERHEAAQLDVAGHLRRDRLELLVRDHDHLAFVGFVAAHQLVVVELLVFLRAVILATERVPGLVDQLHRRLSRANRGQQIDRNADESERDRSGPHGANRRAGVFSAACLRSAIAFALRQPSSPSRPRCWPAGCPRDSRTAPSSCAGPARSSRRAPWLRSACTAACDTRSAIPKDRSRFRWKRRTGAPASARPRRGVFALAGSMPEKLSTWSARRNVESIR